MCTNKILNYLLTNKQTKIAAFFKAKKIIIKAELSHAHKINLGNFIFLYLKYTE